MTGKYLITTDNYFFAPDGKQYRAVWGDCKVISTREALGFDPNRNSANWFVRVGSEESHVLLAGCQIHYSVRLDVCPNLGEVQERVGTDYELKTRDCGIFVPVMADRPVAKSIECLMADRPVAKSIECLMDEPEHVWHEYDVYKSLRGCKVMGKQVFSMSEDQTGSQQSVGRYAKKIVDTYKDQAKYFYAYMAVNILKISRMLAFDSREYLSVLIFIRNVEQPVYFCFRK